VRRHVKKWLLVVFVALFTRALSAQSADTPDNQRPATDQTNVHSHDQPSDQAPTWDFGIDGVAYGTFNHQGSRRGATDFRSTNWLMAMATRPIGPASLTLTGMFSAEPLTVGLAGYAEIFQEGEAYHGLQITDRQHPHDLIMQLAASLRFPIGDTASVTFAGGPVGEPSLGPVPFMHRPSSAGNPTVPLSHHIFDSTHVSSTVVLTRFEIGPAAIEGSVFHGRESDEDRYDISPGRPDSWAVRAWLGAGNGWTLQASHGFLHEPEELEPGDQLRTNASASWLREADPDFSAVTVAVGRNARPYSVVTSLLAEASHRQWRTTFFGRFERTSVETEILLFPEIVHRPHPGELVDPIRALTMGAVRDVMTFHGMALGAGGDVTVYGVPTLLAVTHGSNPTSFQVFVRLERAGLEGRMWNGTMGSGMSHHHHHQ